jgi:hypothetical protein
VGILSCLRWRLSTSALCLLLFKKAIYAIFMIADLRLSANTTFFKYHHGFTIAPHRHGQLLLQGLGWEMDRSNTLTIAIRPRGRFQVSFQTRALLQSGKAIDHQRCIFVAIAT